MAHIFKRRLVSSAFPRRDGRLRSGGVVLLCGLLSLAVGGGCQRGSKWNLAPVEGTVTNEGRPLAGAMVVFLADTEAGTTGPRASGWTDAAGHYLLRTDQGEEGVVPGKHRVLILVSQLPKDEVVAGVKIP